RPEGEKAVLISRNLRFALYQGLKLYPKAKSFILLEDDLLVAPDFYSFMKQMEPIFEMDKTVMCVSAFNHLSYPHTSSDPSLTYRVQSYPAYGWMMPRYIIEEILPKWMPSNFSHDWDYFIGSKFVQRDRDCIVPDINRSYHWSTKGFHLTASYASEILFLSRTMNSDPKVKLYPLDRLIKKNYEMEFENLLRNSTAVTFKERSDLDRVVSPGKSYVVFVQKKNDSDDSSFRLFGEVSYITITTTTTTTTKISTNTYNQLTALWCLLLRTDSF
ncbi:Protein O-linked-mannose beta-1,2-N-acetylglucosaminyltransferase 1, partial [Armadillidium vulgare]